MKNTAIKRVISVCLIVFLVFAQTVCGSRSVNDLKTELAENKKQTEQLKKEIKNKEADLDSATARMNELDVEIGGVQNDIDDVQAVIDEKQAKIDQTNAEIESINTELKNTKEKLKSRMKVMYEYGATSYLEILLDSKSFSDLFTRISAIQAIVRHDNNIMDDYSAQIEALELAKATVETEKNEQVEAKNMLTERQDSLEVLRNEKSKVVNDLKNDLAALEAAEKQKEKDANALQAEIDKALSKSTTTVVYKGNGKFGWPSAASTRVTSEFGYRIHPIFKTKKLHRGMDIGAASGTNVLAAEAGTVLTAGYNSSYGYYVTINHGSGYVTLYAHNSKLLVKAGQTVTRGQVIAKCGSTGNSTGPHIHFEVRVNGKYVNPRNYL